MPTYEYVCRACGREFELFQSMKADPVRDCTCGAQGAVQRKISGGAGLIFKGSGFYETDYKRAGQKKEGGKESGAAAPTPAATPAAPASPAPSASK